MIGLTLSLLEEKDGRSWKPIARLALAVGLGLFFHLTLGIAFWSLAALMLLFAVIDSLLDARDVWGRVDALEGRSADFLLRDMIGWLSALAILAALAAFLPAELGKKADPFAPAPVGIKPEWYFMFMFQTLKYLPSYILGIEGEIVGVAGFGLGGLFLLLIPFLDRRSARGEPSPLFTWIGIAIIAYMIVLTYLGYTASATK